MSDPNIAHYLHHAERWFAGRADKFGEAERRVVANAARQLAIAEDPNRKFDSEATLGDRLADRVAGFGGSWAFIVGFMVFLACWAAFNTVIDRPHAPDPYPFIFLNLILSMLAAIQAPIIMMSQNRQAYKDRRVAAHDYEVNLKAEIEIMALHEKVAGIQQQLEMLTTLIAKIESDRTKP